MNESDKVQPWVTALLEVFPQSQLPLNAWHYTSLDSFIKIIESNTLHASSTVSVNDVSEHSFGTHSLMEYLGMSSVSELISHNAKAQLIDILKNEESYDSKSNSFVFSACEIPDKLSQWARYGGLDGIAINLKPSRNLFPRGRTKREDPETSPGMLIPGWHKVIYSKIAQEEALKKFVLGFEKFSVEYGKAFPNPNSIDLLTKLTLNNLRLILKHHGFAEESEVRYIFSKNSSDYVQFAVRNRRIRKYIELQEMQLDTENLYSPAALPITSIMCGPNFPESQISDLQDFLKTRGFVSTVAHSEIPSLR